MYILYICVYAHKSTDTTEYSVKCLRISCALGFWGHQQHPAHLYTSIMCLVLWWALVLGVKNPPASMQEPWVWSLGQEDPLEKEMAPLQYSCLENPMDRGAWQAAVHGVAQSQTWPKRLGSARRPSHSLLSTLPLHAFYRSAQGDSYVLQWQGVAIAQTVSQSKYLNICWVVQPEIRSYHLEIDHRRTSLVVQWFRRGLPGQRLQVWSLGEELGSHMLLSQKTKT